MFSVYHLLIVSMEYLCCQIVFNFKMYFRYCLLVTVSEYFLPVSTLLFPLLMAFHKIRAMNEEMCLTCLPYWVHSFNVKVKAILSRCCIENTFLHILCFTFLQSISNQLFSVICRWNLGLHIYKQTFYY